ncbi:unnamed protein product [Spirodela intermedia]|uniref:FLZ-type domain-containing protein n=1 Tax=Spirodela intermedia TaxID=51605 RepID=A0A7I8KV87_SPIIN|nr:unnamed protein product [Spirodela intermedia]
MLLGKRPRPPMRRTTSLSEITFDVGGGGEPPHAAAGNPPPPRHQRPPPAVGGADGYICGGYDRRQQAAAAAAPPPQPPYHWPQQQHQDQGPSNGLDTRYLASMVSPRNPRRNSGDFAVEPAPFLRTCGLCKRRLGPGKDTFMYRGEVAFCSMECRQQQITLDERRERKERCSLASMKKDTPELPQSAAAAEAAAAADGETVAAA